MDPRNVRIMKPYADGSCKDDTVYIDEAARDALNIPWGGKCLVIGRRRTSAEVEPLRDEDQLSFNIRMNESMRDRIYCEVGDECLLYNDE